MTRHIVFTGDSAFGSGSFNLWVSDGTLSGTHQVEIEGLDPSIAHLGFLADNYTRLGSKILFTAYDRVGGLQPSDWDSPVSMALWVTDGTSGGTVELGGAKEMGVKGISQYGFYPGGFVPFGDRVAFFGNDSGGRRGLWITDGTVQGTYELGGSGSLGIKGRYFAGLQITNVAALGSNKLLFQGTDVFNHKGLWVTDGTAAGTVEIGGRRNAGIKGALTTDDFTPSNAILVGNRVFFDAVDASYHNCLWTTDGTAKGTVEVGGLGNAGVAGAGSLSGASITIFNGDLVIAGSDKDYYPAVWISDGTAKGTVELAPGAIGDWATIGHKAMFTASNALWETDGTAQGTHLVFSSASEGVKNAADSGLSIQGLASVGDKAVFEGVDASGQYCLWVTDGTAKGTLEVGGLDNHGVKGAYAGGLDPHDFFSVGDKAYFLGEDAATGSIETLWITDGTAKGTKELDYAEGADPGSLYAHQLTLLPSNLALTIASDLTANHAGVLMTGEIIDDAAVTSLKLYDGGHVLGVGTVHGDNWSLLFKHTAGTYDDLSVVAKDADGRTRTAKAAFDLRIGTAADEHLAGSSGRDIIDGGGGNDTLSGGAGRDVFVFDHQPFPANVDTITDFVHGADTIALDHLVFTAFAQAGDLKASAFHSGSSFASSNDYLLYNASTGALSYDADGNGTSYAAHVIAHLGIGLHLTAHDFKIV